MKELRDLNLVFDTRRRRLLRGAVYAAAGACIAPRIMAAEAPSVDLPFDHGIRALSGAFEGKDTMIVQRTRPPVLEAPFEIFGRGLITPNSQHYVRWHLGRTPRVSREAFRLHVHGHVGRPMTLSMNDLLGSYRSHEVIAVSQCAGNSRGFFNPRVPGSQWGHGAMATGAWRGVRLGDVLRRAGIRAGALCIRFQGLDKPFLPATPTYRKSLPIDHALQDDVLLAYELNGEPLPYLNGFPLRLVVPGWFSTYWVKILGSIEVLAQPDDSYWMTKAYLVDGIPVTRMSPRSFVTSLQPAAKVPADKPLVVSGIAFGGECGIAAVHWRTHSTQPWQAATITERTGRYGFCRWAAAFQPKPGVQSFQVRARNSKGEEQPVHSAWNGSGYGYDSIESVDYEVVA